MGSNYLFAGGFLSALGAVAHLACIVGGPAWYRRLGAGERMVRMIEHRSAVPALITIGIASALFGFAAYALSGGGVLVRLPLLRPVLSAITALYFGRAAALPVLFRLMPDRTIPFLIWSSLIVFGIGSVHGIGLFLAWRELG